jgi:SPP1 family predicted phage head-tail adaptor
MSRKKDVIKLIDLTPKEDEIGNILLEDLTVREILAEKKSIKQSEFYQASIAGLKPEMTFVVWSVEYNQETLLEYKGVRYDIIRTFDSDEKNTELVCEVKTGG